MVDIKEVMKEYKDFKLGNINFKVKKGEFFTLFGRSGCGKSTLLKILAGIDSGYSGDVRVEGDKIRNMSPVELGVSMVFQSPLLLPHINIEENVSFGLKMVKEGRERRLNIARELLKDVELEGFGKRKVEELSGGQKQRVAIARALSMNPKLLLMDEPFSALDHGLRVKMQKLLKKIQEKYKTTIIFVTHDRDEAFYLSHRMAIMSEGRIEQIAAPEELYRNPKNEFVARFLGMDNIIDGYLEKDILRTEIFNVKVNTKKIERVAFKKVVLKKEDLLVNTEKYKEGVEVKLVDETFRGGFYHLFVETGGITFEVVQKEIDYSGEEGEKLYLHYDKDKFLYI